MEKLKMCCGLPKFASPSRLYLHAPRDTSLALPHDTSLPSPHGTSLSSPLSSHSPTTVTFSKLPSYEYNSAFELCPSLVRIHVAIDSGKRVSDFGFVACREGDITTVWGSSWFLYKRKADKRNEAKELVDGKVFVSSDHPDFEGVVTYVDYVKNLVVIKCEIPVSKYLPAAPLGRLNPTMMYKDHFICLDYYSYVHTYVVGTYTFKAVSDGENKTCQSHLHFAGGLQTYQGVILNSQMEIVGMKVARCQMDETLAHVLSIVQVAECLNSHTYSHGRILNDIRVRPKEEMRVADLKKKIEVFGICLKEAQMKLEEALKEASQVQH